MLPVLFELGGFEVSSFGVMVALAFVVAAAVTARELGRRGEDPSQAWSLAAYAAVFGVLGSKVYYLVLHWSDTVADPGAALTARSGLVWYGGFALAAVVVAWRVHRLRLPVPVVADAVAPGLALGYAVGRIGCFLVGDDYGRPTDLPWGIAFPDGAPPSTAGNLRGFGADVPASVADDVVLAVHPTQLYETALSLVVFLVVWTLRRRIAAPGALFALWLALAGAERLVVEVFRAKDDRLLGPVSVAQVISLLIVAAGVAGYGYAVRRAAARTGAAETVRSP